MSNYDFLIYRNLCNADNVRNLNNLNQKLFKYFFLYRFKIENIFLS